MSSSFFILRPFLFGLHSFKWLMVQSMDPYALLPSLLEGLLEAFSSSPPLPFTFILVTNLFTLSTLFTLRSSTYNSHREHVGPSVQYSHLNSNRCVTETYRRLIHEYVWCHLTFRQCRFDISVNMARRGVLLGS